MTARSCSARAGAKRIYIRMPDSRRKASTCFAAAVLRRISGVEKFIPRSSTACFRRRRESVNFVQTSITCSTVSGIERVGRQRGPQQGRRDKLGMHFLLYRPGIEFPSRGKSAGTNMAAYQ